MSNIQEIRTLEQCIYDIVVNYINRQYNEEDVLSISRRNGKIVLNADAKKNFKKGMRTELHPLCDLVRTDNDGKPEADIDKITQIANSWLYL